MMHCNLVVTTLQKFEWIINWEKGRLCAKLDMQMSTVSLPSAQFQDILAVEEVHAANYLLARSCLQLLVTMTLVILIVKWDLVALLSVSEQLLISGFPEVVLKDIDNPRDLVSSNLGHQWVGLGRNLQRSLVSEPVDPVSERGSFQQTGTKSGSSGPSCIQSHDMRRLGAPKDWQCHSGGLHQEAAEHAAPFFLEGSGIYNELGPEEPSPPIYVPGQVNLQVDYLSKKSINNKWVLLLQVVQPFLDWSFHPEADLSSSVDNAKLRKVWDIVITKGP